MREGQLGQWWVGVRQPASVVMQPPKAAGDDWQLLATAQAGEGGFDMLFARHKDYVYRLAWGFTGDHALADDVTQEVFLRLVKTKRWQPKALFRTWLYKIVLNTSRELRRRHRRETDALPSDYDERRGAEPEDGKHDHEVAKALKNLPERQREVVVLRFYEELSTKETARIMGCREGTVKTHLHRALVALRDVLTAAVD
ncbi:RNA polymerase sigma factor [Candidatus Entotheonella palauensis]|uniref:RNA polymerase sigma factor n=1 Tax=Candidatus Entotheonella gemina TaxID=1429439 RepID=W4M602_9BACT|nr:RNA polymerase sigma factor [Candidatus Entotheonella palauensis]ETX05067.1 MAG: hypothetical protein ETSY2_25190 [Candidatus Entotheonella gemina]